MNPANTMTSTSAVDGELEKFRGLQSELQNLIGSQQKLMAQHAENEMVKQELLLMDGSAAPVYKKVGPVLLNQTLDEAKETVDKRLEFISAELDKVEGKIKGLEDKQRAQAQKIQEMQKSMQNAALEAARQVAQEQSA